MHVLTPYIVSCVIIYMFGSVYACEFLMDKGFFKSKLEILF
jgi:hypothetical protein